MRLLFCRPTLICLGTELGAALECASDARLCRNAADILRRVIAWIAHKRAVLVACFDGEDEWVLFSRAGREYCYSYTCRLVSST